MRILQVSANYPPKIGGPSSSVPELSKRLAERGHKVHVITQNFPGFRKECFENNFFVHRADSLQKNPAKASWIENASAVLSMAALVRKVSRKEKTELIHAHDLNISSAAVALGNADNLPLISKYTGDVSLEFLLANSKMPAQQVLQKYSCNKASVPASVKLLDFCQKKLAQNAKLIACPSIFQKEQIIKQGIPKEKTTVLRNAVNLGLFNLARFRQEKKGKEFKVVFAGRLVAWKGVSFLLEAFASALKKNRQLRLLIAGEGPEREKLELLSKKLGIQGKADFLGKIPHEKTPELIASAELVVLPSLYDPFPHGMLECLAMKKPLLASNVCGIPEVVRHKKTGFLVEPADSGQLAEAITTLSENNALRKKIAENGRALMVKEFSWEKTIPEVEKAYEQAMR